jgi:hypothetical protein
MNEIKTVAETYIRIRRSLGFKMKREEKLLSQFIKFLEMQGSAYITSSVALSWAVQPRDCHPGNWRNRLFWFLIPRCLRRGCRLNKGPGLALGFNTLYLQYDGLQSTFMPWTRERRFRQGTY